MRAALNGSASSKGLARGMGSGIHSGSGWNGGWSKGPKRRGGCGITMKTALESDDDVLLLDELLDENQSDQGNAKEEETICAVPCAEESLSGRGFEAELSASSSEDSGSACERAAESAPARQCAA